MPSSHVFFICSQHYPHVEAWIVDQIDSPVTNAGSQSARTFYCCILLEYLHFHNRWSDFCKKCLEIVNDKGYRVSLDHKIAWLHVALNSTNGRSSQELPQKGTIIDQIQLCLKVLHLHKLAHDRLCNLLTVQQNDYSRIKRFAIHFRMWNCRTTGPFHKFEDFTYRVGPYDNQRTHINGKVRGCLHDDATSANPGTSMLGTLTPDQRTFEKGLLAQYKDDLCDGVIAYPDHASFRKILSNSMFFDLEITLLHLVLPIQNQQDIQKCIEKIMVQSFFQDSTTASPFPADDHLLDQHQAQIEVVEDWGRFCMRHHFEETFVAAHIEASSDYEHQYQVGPLGKAIESLRRHVHNFFEIAPKSQDVLRIMFPPEVLVTFACTHITKGWPTSISSRGRRHYVCAIADILLGYTSTLEHDIFIHRIGQLTDQKHHAFISYNALHPEGYRFKRAKSRDRCISLKTLWDALPHISRNLPDEKFLTTKLAFAARYACPLTLHCQCSHFSTDLLARLRRPYDVMCYKTDLLSTWQCSNIDCITTGARPNMSFFVLDVR